jgi:ribonuclease P protein component
VTDRDETRPAPLPDRRTEAPRPRLFFPRAARIQKSSEFQRVFKEGSRARGSFLTVAVMENELGRTRLGLSVGRAAWKRAVQRNRLRRLFREAFRLDLPTLAPGLDVVVIGSTPKADPKLADLRAELTALVRKAHARFREKRAGAAAPPTEARSEGEA